VETTEMYAGIITPPKQHKELVTKIVVGAVGGAVLAALLKSRSAT